MQVPAVPPQWRTPPPPTMWTGRRWGAVGSCPLPWRLRGWWSPPTADTGRCLWWHMRLWGWQGEAMGWNKEAEYCIMEDLCLQWRPWSGIWSPCADIWSPCCQMKALCWHSEPLCWHMKAFADTVSPCVEGLVLTWRPLLTQWAPVLKALCWHKKALCWHMKPCAGTVSPCAELGGSSCDTSDLKLWKVNSQTETETEINQIHQISTSS